MTAGHPGGVRDTLDGYFPCAMKPAHMDKPDTGQEIRKCSQRLPFFEVPEVVFPANSPELHQVVAINAVER